MVGEEERRPKSGFLTSPNYPERYPNSHDSTQTIQVAEGKTIRWSWTHFDTESSRYDYVQIVDEDGTNLTAKLGGTRLPAKIGGARLPIPGASNWNIVHVKFHTDGDRQRTGWRLEWSKNGSLLLMNQSIMMEGIINVQSHE